MTGTLLLMSNNNKTLYGMYNKMNKLKVLAASVGGLLATAAAHAQQSQYVTDITDGVNSVVGIWDVIVPVMIGIVVVTIGLRFAKKLR